MWNYTQKIIVISFMVDHDEFAKGHQTDLGPYGRITYRDMWDRLLQDVNQTGPPMTREQLKRHITLTSSNLDFSPNNVTLTFEQLLDNVDNNILDLASHELHEVPIDVDSSVGITSITKTEVQENLLEELPDAIRSLQDLRYLNVPSNILKSLPLGMSLLQKLKYLNVSANPLEGPLLEVAGSCKDSEDCNRCAGMVVSYLAAVKFQKESGDAAKKVTNIQSPYFLQNGNDADQDKENVLEEDEKA
ncbi:hypothetical protein QAD02_020459 [Eretmocerus hayati]|uniref:Uncharacterized protein n=1 Tax=Eretmocerus hayati TaxID=131215 RepID=A0ACC2PMH2_9HYME|nr:hypothetical protein QAD02_020459 [Eretmocerus hayati]